MVAPQVVTNGYIATPPQSGVLRFHHGKMTSSHHVRHRQDVERNQKASYKTGSIADPLNRYNRKIGDGVGIDMKKLKSGAADDVVVVDDWGNVDPWAKSNQEVIDIDDGIDPNLEVGPTIPDGTASGDASAMWGYFMPLNSFTSKCKKCHLVLKLPSSCDAIGKSSSPLVQHLMKCLDTVEYKDFIEKRESRYAKEEKAKERGREQSYEAAVKSGPLLTSIKKDAPIWVLFKKINDGFATCLANNCYKVIRIIRESATAMILHLADDHPTLHDIFNENHKKTKKELDEIIKNHIRKEALEKIEKAKIDKAKKDSEKPRRESESSFDRPMNTKALLETAKNLVEGKRTESIDEVIEQNLVQDFKKNEEFTNNDSTIRQYFVPIGVNFAKCNSCLTTLGVGDDREEGVPSKLEKHLQKSHPKQFEVFEAKREEKRKKMLERKNRKDLKRKIKEEKNSEAGKQKKVDESIKKVMVEDCRSGVSRFSGTAAMMWKYFHQLPNSEMVKCLRCHRVFRRWKNSLGDTTVKLLEHLQEYHKDLHKLFAI